jgi:hypothetical protein
MLGQDIMQLSIGYIFGSGPASLGIAKHEGLEKEERPKGARLFPVPLNAFYRFRLHLNLLTLI